nr:macrophage mannose receptor 1-like [Misgurnus anguillicaudatus]
MDLNNGHPSLEPGLNCAALNAGKASKWESLACSKKLGYICRKGNSTDIKPSTGVDERNFCPVPWVLYAGHCYYLQRTNKTWSDALTACHREGSDLASIHNIEEHSFIISQTGYMSTDELWIGLNDQRIQNLFEWSDRSHVTFTKWFVGEPSHITNRMEDCVLIRGQEGKWSDHLCESAHGFICKKKASIKPEGSPEVISPGFPSKMAEGLTTTREPPTTRPLSCPDKWIKKGPGSCIGIYRNKKEKKKTWFEARDFCRAIGGDLASFHSEDEMNVLPFFTSDPAWIGFTSLDSNSGFVWSDQTPSDYQNWAYEEPNNVNNNENCAEYGTNYDRKWNDRDCDTYMDWICQIPIGITPKSPPASVIQEYNKTSDGWIQYNGSQYFINLDFYSMGEARAFCKKNHADLVVVTGNTERRFIWKQISRRGGSQTQYYIGMTVELDQSFSWVDGSPVVYTAWEQDEPNFANNDENCVTVLKSSGFWNDVNCGLSLPSICKRSADFVNTTVSPTTVPAGGCAPEWTLFRGKCYKFFDNKMYWEQARDHCISNEGNLVSIWSRTEQFFLTTLMLSAVDDVWIGANDIDTDKTFVWAEHRAVKYTNWLKGEPSSMGNDCVVMVKHPEKSTGMWKVEDCGDKKGFICKRNTDSQLSAPVTTAVPQKYFSLGNDSYKIQLEKMSWDEARRQCKADDADLASVLDSISQAYTSLQVDNLKEPLWIGLNSNLPDGRYRWVDNWFQRYSKWATGEPKNNLACVYIDTDGDWKTAACNNTYYSLCKRSTVFAPTDPPQLPGNCPESDQRNSWIPFRGHCYTFMTSVKDIWVHAAVECIRMGASLVSVEDPIESQFIRQNLEILQVKSAWIGLHPSNKGNWMWIDNTVVDYMNWEPQMPDNVRICVEVQSETGMWSTTSCINHRGYICKTAKVIPSTEKPSVSEGVTTTREPPTTRPLSCPDNWLKKDPGSCVRIYRKEEDDKKTWFEARDFCRAIGGDLASFHSEDEMNVLPYYRSDAAWIGFTSLDSNSGFVWSDQTPSDYQNWASGEPNNVNNNENCAEYGTTYNRRWNDRDCDTYMDWICQIPIGMTPKSPPTSVIQEYNKTSDGWIQYNGSQYFINLDFYSMGEARYFCKKNHADLVVVTGNTERRFLWKQISRSGVLLTQFYIGMTVELDKSFSWVDGSPVVYTAWEQDEPNFANNNENCVTVLRSSGFWNDVNCGLSLPSICKRSADFVNTTVSPTTVPPGGCAPEWTLFRGKCYKFFDNKMYWEQARDHCISNKGNLVSIWSRTEQSFLTTLMLSAVDDVWIGARDITLKKKFVWAERRAVKYTNWLKGEPSSMGNECVVMVKHPEKSTGMWKVEDCGDKKGFICKRNTDSQLSAPVTTAVPQKYFSLGNDSYKVQLEKMSWDEARRQCKADDADLASVLDSISQAYTSLQVDKLKEPLWIGLNSNLTDGRYRWVDNWFLSYSKWATGEPKNNLACVYIDTDGDWKTAACNNTYYSLCKRSTVFAPTDPPQLPGNCPESDHRNSWIPFRGHCYTFMTSIKDIWAKATVECIRMGASLVSIEDPIESQFIRQNLEILQDEVKSVWIGLHRSHKGDWMWVDNTVVDYTNWKPRMPDDVNICVEVQSETGMWSTINCDDQRGYICKTAKVIPPTEKPSVSDDCQVDQRCHGWLASLWWSCWS